MPTSSSTVNTASMGGCTSEACGKQWQLTLVGVVHRDEHVAACRQATVIGGQLALSERMREVTVKAHDLAGGTPL